MRGTTGCQPYARGEYLILLICIYQVHTYGRSSYIRAYFSRLWASSTGQHHIHVCMICWLWKDMHITTGYYESRVRGGTSIRRDDRAYCLLRVTWYIMMKRRADEPLVYGPNIRPTYYDDILRISLRGRYCFLRL